MNRSTFMLLLLAGGGYLMWKNRLRLRYDKMKIVPQTEFGYAQLPTDSMAPGAMPAAVQGLVKENGQLAMMV